MSEWLDAYKPSDLDVRTYIMQKVAQNSSIVDRLAKIAGLKCKILNKAIKTYADYKGKQTVIPSMLEPIVKSEKRLTSFLKLIKS